MRSSGLSCRSDLLVGVGLALRDLKPGDRNMNAVSLKIHEDTAGYAFIDLTATMA